MLLTIHHRTTYRYARPVTLAPHRLLLCPRGNFDLKLVSRKLDLSPPATVDWSQDVFGNLIATATFSGPTDLLTIDSRSVVEQCAQEWPIFSIAPFAHQHPFDYAPDDLRDLGALHDVDLAGGPLAAWVHSFARIDPQDSLSLLQAINGRINREVNYRSRDEEGTQSASETLAIASGSCRDMATLFIAAARALGFGARAVSGYLYDPASEAQHGSTHAWADVYLPGAGWIAFDPTNGRMGSANLIPVAVARAIGQIMPVTGGFTGGLDDFTNMDVDVSVTAGANQA